MITEFNVEAVSVPNIIKICIRLKFICLGKETMPVYSHPAITYFLKYGCEVTFRNASQSTSNCLPSKIGIRTGWIAIMNKKNPPILSIALLPEAWGAC